MTLKLAVSITLLLLTPLSACALSFLIFIINPPLHVAFL